MLSYMWREALELQRDPVRATLALAGSLLLMFVIGFGISLDVEDLRYAVMDRDQTGLSQNYALNLSGSRYFIEHRPVTDYQDMDARMRSGLSLAIEIPQGFARDAQRGKPAQIGVDRRRHAAARRDHPWLRAGHAPGLAGAAGASAWASPRRPPPAWRRAFANPDVRSLPAMVPGRDSAAAAHDARHADRAGGGAGERAGLHHQPVRHAGHAAGIPAGQTGAMWRWPC